MNYITYSIEENAPVFKEINGERWAKVSYTHKVEINLPTHKHTEEIDYKQYVLEANMDDAVIHVEAMETEAEWMFIVDDLNFTLNQAISTNDVMPLIQFKQNTFKINGEQSMMANLFECIEVQLNEMDPFANAMTSWR